MRPYLDQTHARQGKLRERHQSELFDHLRQVTSFAKEFIHIGRLEEMKG